MPRPRLKADGYEFSGQPPAPHNQVASRPVGSVSNPCPQGLFKRLWATLWGCPRRGWTGWERSPESVPSLSIPAGSRGTVHRPPRYRAPQHIGGTHAKAGRTSS